MTRERLSEIFHSLCKNVYFQPPEDVKLKYPCIIYEERTGDTLYADDYPYRFTKCYTVTCIDSNPDSEIPGQIAMLQMCREDRKFTSANLNHTVFILYA